ncbi:MAG: hypothetical protein QG580_45 [Patescibacteria group bacterium]|jgi:prepilin-type N-terminal cleavage/methylation domain-containing protein|nr:hypothetical protein [Patescibacteria group bacterium]
MKFFKFKKESGFTLVETLVAIAIFATAITGLIVISGRGINDNVFVKNKLTASYLAQEGVEIIRMMRDNAALANPSSDYWENFINNIDVCYSPDGTDVCWVDPAGPSIGPCDNQICENLGYDEYTGIYGYGFEESIFNREVRVVPVEDYEEILIISDVSWTQGSNTYKTSYQYNLLNWVY